MTNPKSSVVHDLVIAFADLTTTIIDEVSRTAATCTVMHRVSGDDHCVIRSARHEFIAPEVAVKAEDLAWYLETYYSWPVGIFQHRAMQIESQLPVWGTALFTAAFGSAESRLVLKSWQELDASIDRRIAIVVDYHRQSPCNFSQDDACAAAALLALPWELIHDGRSYLFESAGGVRVRRQVPDHREIASAGRLPLRILLVSPRPDVDADGDRLADIDHRVSARPLLDAVEPLQNLVHVTVVRPPTFAAVKNALRDAEREGRPFDVFHFDGHGNFDSATGVGGLCFEDSRDATNADLRRLDFVHAPALGDLFERYRVRLVFLEACRSATAHDDPTASVSGALLQSGVASVVAMTHSVLVETSRRFVEPFYRELAGGAPVGQAMLVSQRALFVDSWRGKGVGGELRLLDWFVPVLYQHDDDPPMLGNTGSEKAPSSVLMDGNVAANRLHGLPELYGRNRQLLFLERLLHHHQWGVVLGNSGIGKTALVKELAEWLHRSGRFQSVAFVDLERQGSALAVLDSIGRQVTVSGGKYSALKSKGLDAAMEPVCAALRELHTLIVFDSCESLFLSDSERNENTSGLEHSFDEVADVCSRFLQAAPHTRILFASREALRKPFSNARHTLNLGRLDQWSAIALVSAAISQATPVHPELRIEKQVEDLVEAVGGHPRTLVALAANVARSGIQVMSETLRQAIVEREESRTGNCDNSLFAPIEVCLGRLRSHSREHLKALAFCQTGIHVLALQHVAQTDTDSAVAVGRDLIRVGLCEDAGDGFLRVDPSLPAYVFARLSPSEHRTLHGRWLDAMDQMSHFLYERKDPALAARLAALEAPNLLQTLRTQRQEWPSARVTAMALRVEASLANLGQSRALAAATDIRHKLGEGLVAEQDWTHEHAMHLASEVERHLDRGDAVGAYDAGIRLLEKCVATGNDAYAEAAHDLAWAHVLVGRALRDQGAFDKGLKILSEARGQFERLAANGRSIQMPYRVMTYQADCLAHLGRCDQAAAVYEQSAQMARYHNDHRAVAVNLTQLGNVRILQRRPAQALRVCTEALALYQAMREPRSIAATWHQIGTAHEQSGDLDKAENAHRESLAVEVEHGNVRGQAESLGQIGNLYDARGRPEDAAALYRQALLLHTQIGDRAGETKARYSLARVLMGSSDLNEARSQLEQAMEHRDDLGNPLNAVQPWVLLDRLERLAGNVESANCAREEVFRIYLSYRRQGRASLAEKPELFQLVLGAVLENDTAALDRDLNTFRTRPHIPAHGLVLIDKLRRVLAGNRETALAEDPDLNCLHAAELRLLLDELATRTRHAESGV